MNHRLVSIFGDDDFNLFTSNSPVVLEAMGTTAQRLRTLESALGAQPAEGEAADD